MNYLVDVNVWLALALIGHVHQTTTLKWFEESAIGLTYFCRVTQQGLLRLLTNPKVMGANILTAGDAWKLYDTLYQDSRVRFAEEPPGLEDLWREQTRGVQTSPNFWTDAYLAAFAAATGLTIVTFDKQFALRKNVSVRLLG